MNIFELIFWLMAITALIWAARFTWEQIKNERDMFK